MDNDLAYLLELTSGGLQTQVLDVLVRLGVADHLAADIRTVEELALLTETHEPALTRLLRAGTALGVIEARPDGKISLTAAGSLLRSDVPGSIRNLVMMPGKTVKWRAWEHLEYCVRTGRPAVDHVFGQPVFQYLAEHPDEEAVFTAAMAEISRLAAPGIVARIDLAGVAVLADIGGGSGTLLAGFLTTFPQLRGVLFDSPSGLGDAEQLLTTAGVADRCEITAGDFFVSVPAGCDAYLLKSVIHDWDDEQATRILANCRAAMPPHATLFLAERVVPDDPAELVEERFMLLTDLEMLIGTGGRERTGDEFAVVLHRAGFTLEDVTRCPTPIHYNVLRARPSSSR